MAVDATRANRTIGWFSLSVYNGSGKQKSNEYKNREDTRHYPEKFTTIISGNNELPQLPDAVLKSNFSSKVINHKFSSKWIRAALSVFIFAALSGCDSGPTPYTTWEVYRGDKGSTGYSALNQINKTNLNRLKVAWVYHTGDARAGNRSTIQCNPIIVNKMMYVTSPQLKLIALHPGTGEALWRFDPFAKETATGVNRGVTYWEDGGDKRIFFSAGKYLYALNAGNGRLIDEFGDRGKVDLRVGLGRDTALLDVSARYCHKNQNNFFISSYLYS